MKITVPNFLTLDPKTLRKEQYAILKDHMLRRLKNVYDLIAEDDLEKLDQVIGSPADKGDASDIRFINFSYEPGKIMDIGAVLYQLKDIRSKMEREQS